MTAPEPHPPPHQAAALSARQAAADLGVNEKTVRRWIERGRLPATKNESGAYRIDPADLARNRAAHAADTPHQGAALAADTAADTAAAPAAPVDLQPLVDLVADLTRKNAELTEAATVWQFRARQLEEQVKALTTGDGDPRQDAPDAAPFGRSGAEGADRQSEASAGAGGSWVAHLWRRARGR